MGRQRGSRGPPGRGWHTPLCYWPTPLNLPLWVRAYEAGLSMETIAAAQGHNESWLRDLFVKAGVPRRPRGRYQARWAPKPGSDSMPFPAPLNLWAMADAYASGLSLADVAERFSWSRFCLAQLFERAGIPRRRAAIVVGSPGWERAREAARRGGAKNRLRWRLLKAEPPPPIVHHLRPARTTWPIGAVPTGPWCKIDSK